jgi:hypothetical protein
MTDTPTHPGLLYRLDHLEKIVGELDGNLAAVINDGATRDGPTLASALCDAQRSLRGLQTDARNDFARYSYVSSDKMIEAGSRALSAAGLALVTVENQIDPLTVDSTTFLRHRRVFRLLHTSGESVDMEHVWVAALAKGRPWDKAIASSDTTGLSYFLRGLLLVARGDESDDMDHTQSKPEPSGSPAFHEFLERLERTEMKLAPLADMLAAMDRPNPAKMDAAQLSGLIGWLKTADGRKGYRRFITDTGARS